MSNGQPRCVLNKPWTLLPRTGQGRGHSWLWDFETTLHYHAPPLLDFIMLGHWVPLQSSWEVVLHPSLLPPLLKAGCMHGLWAPAWASSG